MAARQFIYHMQGLTKTWPGGKKVLENINLSFYPDAKIGVLGVNGSGKSTLLRIMAGLDTEFVGEGFVAEGAKVGYLPQEPASRSGADRARQRHARRQGEAGDPRPLQRAGDELFRRDRRRDDAAAGRDRGQGPVGSRQPGRAGDGRARLPARRCPTWPRSPAASAAASRSAGCCWRSRTCCCSTSRPTISTPRRSTGSKGTCAHYPGAILIVTHDRYFLDNVTGWILELDRGRGIPYEGNYSSWLKQKQKRLEQEGREDAARQRALAEESEWIAASPKARQAKSKARIAAYDELVRKQSEKAPTTAQIIIPGGRAARPERHRLRRSVEGLRRPAADRQAHVQAAARRHRRRHRPQRRRQDDALPHDHRPGEAGFGVDQDRRIRCSSAMSTSRATRSTARRPCGRKSPAATTSSLSPSAR